MSNATRDAAKGARRGTKGKAAKAGDSISGSVGESMGISRSAATWGGRMAGPALPPAYSLPAASLPPDKETPRLGRVTELLGGRKVFPHQPTTPLEAHEMLRDGLPARSMGNLVNALGPLGARTEPSLAKALGTSWRTIQRQKKTPGKRLSQEQSGRMWKFAEILAKATEVFGSQPDAEQWMMHPATGLEQRRPIELLETPAGTEIVEDFLGRLEYGVYT
jgi:putative toxin-antitoxin system antitoxin component (TIGR02293 family)